MAGAWSGTKHRQKSGMRKNCNLNQKRAAFFRSEKNREMKRQEGTKL